ncbi:hypothetical protein AF332_11850 [Sporosarcina globispora]|uniref:Uncharacterized protein n=2 Tax=Sporosarcina globispora TaxID=1459 RepID=A0A0M0GD66_SPOGL|nr:hypothetical protein AF332_11850 [Sporosarcina globispora]
MDLEINKLMESEVEEIRDIASLLYDSNQKGLSESDTYDLAGLLLGLNAKLDTFVQEETNKIYMEGFNEGYKEAKDTYQNCLYLK